MRKIIKISTASILRSVERGKDVMVEIKVIDGQIYTKVVESL